MEHSHQLIFLLCNLLILGLAVAARYPATSMTYFAPSAAPAPGPSPGCSQKFLNGTMLCSCNRLSETDPDATSITAGLRDMVSTGNNITTQHGKLFGALVCYNQATCKACASHAQMYAASLCRYAEQVLYGTSDCFLSYIVPPPNTWVTWFISQGDWLIRSFYRHL